MSDDLSPEASQLKAKLVQLFKSGDDAKIMSAMELLASLDDSDTSQQVRESIIELDVSECESMTDVDALKGLVNLEYLRLCDCESLENIDGLKGLVNLEKLVFEGCSSVTNVDALSGLVNLEELWLEECDALEDLKGLAGLENLDWLNLVGCSSLPTTWQTIFDTQEACAKLREKIANGQYE